MSTQEVIAICERKLLGTPYEGQDITYAVNEAEFYIRNYTGRWQIVNDVKEELPSAMNYIWADIAVGIVVIGNEAISNLSNAGSSSAVKQIKEGDTTIEFEVGAGAGNTGYKAANNLVASYASELNQFRRLYPNVINFPNNQGNL